MPYARKRTRYAGGGMFNYAKGRIHKPRVKRKFPKKRMNIAKVVNKIMARKIETKQSTSTATDGTMIRHNNFVLLDGPSTFLKTVQGTQDPMAGTGERIGDEITLKGIVLKMMIQNDPRYNNVTYRLMLVRSAKGDTPTRATLFKGISGNKMLDQINKERYTIVASKMFKINNNNAASNAGLISSLGVDYGIYTLDNTQTVYSPPTKIVNLYIPGGKIAKGGRIQYENADTFQVKFYDYSLVLYAYANLKTSQDLVDIGMVNDYIKIMYYTDA